MAFFYLTRYSGIMTIPDVAPLKENAFDFIYCRCDKETQVHQNAHLLPCGLLEHRIIH